LKQLRNQRELLSAQRLLEIWGGFVPRPFAVLARDELMKHVYQSVFDHARFRGPERRKSEQGLRRLHQHLSGKASLQHAHKRCDCAVLHHPKAAVGILSKQRYRGCPARKDGTISSITTELPCHHFCNDFRSTFLKKHHPHLRMRREFHQRPDRVLSRHQSRHILSTLSDRKSAYRQQRPLSTTS
jgi:hypothetical protein